MRLILTTPALLLALALPLLAADKPEDLTPQRRMELEKKIGDLNQEASRQYRAGHYVEARDLLREVLEMCRVLYPKDKYPQGHPELAVRINNLAFLHQATGEYAKAEPLLKEVLEMNRALFPKDKFPQGHPFLAGSLNNLAFLHQATGEYAKAEPLYKEALDMARALFPKEQYPQGHPQLATGIGNLAMLHYYAGEYAKAELLYKESLAMRRALYPKDKYPHGHPELATGVNNLAALHNDVGEYDKAEPLYKESLAMYRALYPKEKYPLGHPDLAVGINSLAALYGAAGEHGQAEPLLKESLAMRRALYPKDKYPRGHPLLATGIANLAREYEIAGEHDEAELLFKEALGMRRTLYPKEKYPQGHPELAASISGLASLHQGAGEYGTAEPLLKEALAMRRALFPKEKYPLGHPDLATSINNLAFLHQDTGERGQAEPLFKEALAMRRALFPRDKYPQGHPELASSIRNLAGLHHWTGEYGKAVPLLKEALDMDQGLVLRYADLAAEAQAINYLHTFPLTRDALLSASRHLSDSASVYDALWNGRAALTRLQERRHRDLMAGRDKETADLADQLRLTRLSLSGLLLKPGRDLDAHRAKVQKLTQEKEDLEKRIAVKLKLAAPKTVATAPTARQLADALPDGAAFVDFYRYIDFEQDPEVRGKKGAKRTPRYVAFVLRGDKAVARVELKEAGVIDAAWATWQKSLTADHPNDKAERAAAAELAGLVWQPLREALPADLKTVYLAPDGKLNQLPWGALPGKKPDTMLLDECAVCLVPHGPFLLERLLEKPAERAADILLAYGGVDYAGEPAAVLKPHDDVRGPLLREKRLTWGDLPGTAKEQEQIVALAKKVLKTGPITRNGRNANTKQLEEDLPRARYAHLATHGFFADPEFRSAIQVDPRLFEFGGIGDRRGGARSPLVLSGLVLAGANRRGDEAAPDRGIITAEGLIGLRMEGLELAVLSACETGLGADGGGEGVYGLQRAFHIAGCRNVIASLWKVDDGATQALMALFYRNLWEKKMDAAEALRQAQLTLYRHPEAVEVAKKRGVDFTESDLPKVEEKPTKKAQRSPTAHWAAFTFSGVRPRK